MPGMVRPQSQWGMSCVLHILKCYVFPTSKQWEPNNSPELRQQTTFASFILEVFMYSYSFSRVPTLCDPMDCIPPGSSVHGFLHARILEWVAILFSRGIFPTQGLNPGVLHCRQIFSFLPSKLLGTDRRLSKNKKNQWLWLPMTCDWKILGIDTYFTY